MKPTPISRRTVLRGLGAAVTVPWLEAMGPLTIASAAAAASPAAAAAAKHPVRLAVLYMANGVNEHAWTPSGQGRDFDLSPTLSPLASVKDEILVFTELMNAGSTGGDGHYVKTSGFLTGTTITKTTGKDLRSGGTSMDQLAAQRIGRLTPLPSLELGIEPVTTGIDTNVGYTRLYGSHVSWSTPTTPLAKEINPRLAFNRLFKSSAAATSADDKSILDIVSDDAKSLRAQVGRADQQKLDNYLESIRAVEKRIEHNLRVRAEQEDVRPEVLTALDELDKRIQTWEVNPERSKQLNRRNPGDHTEHVRLMLDLMVLAFWSDSTRVSTFMFGNAVSGKNFSFLDGVKGGHHQLSHHENKPENLEQYQKINQWHVAQYAYMLERMKSIREGAGTLLDNSMILFGSGIKDGNKHDPKNLPLVLAGKAGGTLATGRHLTYKRNTPLCNLYASMLDRMNTPVNRFGDSTGKLKGLDDPTFSGEVA